MICTWNLAKLMRLVGHKSKEKISRKRISTETVVRFGFCMYHELYAATSAPFHSTESASLPLGVAVRTPTTLNQLWPHCQTVTARLCPTPLKSADPGKHPNLLNAAAKEPYSPFHVSLWNPDAYSTSHLPVHLTRWSGS